MIRKIFLEDLPQFKIWNECVGCSVRFIYDDIEGKVEIVSYDKESRKLGIRYLDSDKFLINTDNFKKCKLGNLLNRRTSRFKHEINDCFSDNKRDFIITKKEYVEDKKGKTKRKYYQYKCNICGWDKGIISEYHLEQGQGCSCCNGKVPVVGINDITTTAPWMIKYFQGGKEEAKKYTKASTKHIIPICPDCGKIKEKKVYINNVYRTQSIGCNCSDGVSYPEKFLFNIFNQLDLGFVWQYTKKDAEWCAEYKYDFYLYEEDVIIEAQGSQHRDTKYYKEFSFSNSVKKDNDEDKEKLANDNVKGYIKIDCSLSDRYFIENEIKKSKLGKLYDFSLVRFEVADEYAQKNLIKEVSKYWNDNPGITTGEIGKIFKLNFNTVSRYLKKGSELNWCNYNAKEEGDRIRNINIDNNKKRIRVYDQQMNFLGEYESATWIERNSEEIFGKRLLRSKICLVANGHIKSYNGYIFKKIIK